MTVEAVIMAELEVALPEGQVLFVTPLMDMLEPAEPNLPAETQELHAILQPVVHSVKAVMHTTARTPAAVAAAGMAVAVVPVVLGEAPVAAALLIPTPISAAIPLIRKAQIPATEKLLFPILSPSAKVSALR
jgi:hypothetical protein